MKHSCFKWLAMNRMTKQIMTEKNGCFTKHPLKNGCFRYQVLPKPILRKFLRHSGSGFQAIPPCPLLQRWGRSCHPTPNVPASRMEGVDGWYASFPRIQSSTPGWDLILNLHLPLLEGEHVSKLQHDLKL